MKFISFRYEGAEKFGIINNDKITDLTGKIFNAKTLKDLIIENGFNEAKILKENSGNIDVSDEYLPLIPNPGKIICVGLNYSEHVKETNRTVEENPVILQFPESQTAHLQPIQRPMLLKFRFWRWNGSYVGEGGKHIKTEDALKHIVGYSCYNESTIRDWQRHTRQFGMGKNFEKTGGFGPHMVLAEDIKDYKELTLETRLNGEVMQNAKLSN